MKIQINKIDIIWNYLGIIMNMLGNFLILPFLLIFLSDEMYGLWNIFVSIGGIATLFDFGFNVTFARNITYCWSGVSILPEDKVEQSLNEQIDFRLMKIVLFTCKKVYLLISCVALIVLYILGTGYVLYISDYANAEIVIAWLIYAVGILLNLYYGYYDSFLRGIGAISIVNKLKVRARVIQILVTGSVLLLGWGIIGASLGYLLYGVCFRGSAKREFYNYESIGDKLNNNHDELPQSEIKNIFMSIWHSAWRDGMVQMSDYLVNHASVILASFYLSLSEIGMYSLMLQLAQAVVVISTAGYNAYQPTLQSAYVRRDEEKIRNIMSAILISYFTVAIIGFMGIYIIGIPMISLINNLLITNRSYFVGIWCYQFILKWRNCYTSYLAATNRIIYAKSFLISGFVTIISLFVFFNLGHPEVLSIVWAQLLGQIIYNVWYWPRKIHKELRLPIKEVVPRGISELKKVLYR